MKEGKEAASGIVCECWARAHRHAFKSLMHLGFSRLPVTCLLLPKGPCRMKIEQLCNTRSDVHHFTNAATFMSVNSTVNNDMTDSGQSYSGPVPLKPDLLSEARSTQARPCVVVEHLEPCCWNHPAAGTTLLLEPPCCWNHLNPEHQDT